MREREKKFENGLNWLDVFQRQEYEIEQQQKFQAIEEEKKKFEEKEKLECMKAEKWSHDKYDEIAQEDKVWAGMICFFNTDSYSLALEKTIFLEAAIVCSKTTYCSSSVDR